MLFPHTLMSLRCKWTTGNIVTYTDDFSGFCILCGKQLLHNHFLGTNSHVIIDMSKSLFSSTNLHAKQFFPFQKNPPCFNIMCQSNMTTTYSYLTHNLTLWLFFGKVQKVFSCQAGWKGRRVGRGQWKSEKTT